MMLGTALLVAYALFQMWNGEDDAQKIINIANSKQQNVTSINQK